MTVGEFIAARLGDDEHWAHMAEAGWPPENALAASADPEHYAFMATDIAPSKATFIRRHDPGRVLREVAAKRAILAEHELEMGFTYTACPEHHIALTAGDPERFTKMAACPRCTKRPFGSCRRCESDEYPCRTIRALAAVWSDHSDYRQEWKP